MNRLGAFLAVFAVVSTQSAFAAVRNEPDRPVIPPARDGIPRFVEGSGTIEPAHAIEVHSMVEGIVRRVNVDIGDQVRNGDVLFQIEDSAFRDAVAMKKASLTRAKAEAEVAKANLDLQTGRYRRLQTLNDRKAAAGEVEEAAIAVHGAEASLEVAKAGVQEAEVALMRAERELSQTQVISPVAGVVIVREVDVGGFAGIKDSGFVIADPSHLRLRAWIGEKEITEVRLGQSATVEVGPGKKLAAKVHHIAIQPVIVKPEKKFVVDLAIDETKSPPRLFMTGAFSIAVGEDRPK